MLSSIGAGDRIPIMNWQITFRPSTRQTDSQETQLEYAILRPVALTDDEGTGEVRLGENVDPKGGGVRCFACRHAAESPEWVGVYMQTVVLGANFTGIDRKGPVADRATGLRRSHQDGEGQISVMTSASEPRLGSAALKSSAAR